MAADLFRRICDGHLEQLRSFPDIDRDQLIRFFTLTSADVACSETGFTIPYAHTRAVHTSTCQIFL